MRKEGVKATALAALLFGGVLAFGQQPASPAADKTDQGKEQPAKSKLEEMLEKALHDNPDVRLAAAKLAEAEAELTRARLQVVQKVASAYQAVEAQKAAVESATAELAELKAAAGAVDKATIRAAEQKLIDAKAKLADLESQLPYLLGQGPEGADPNLSYYAPAAAWVKRADPEERRRREAAAAIAFLNTSVNGPTADRIRAALDKPFTLEARSDGKHPDMLIGDVIRAVSKAFEESNPGLLIKNNMTPDEVPVPARFDHMPFGAVLEWIEDTVPDCRVVVRDYGIVIAPKDQLPPGAPLLRDFWKGGKDQPSKPPTGLVKGDVKDVDKDGRVRINIGKNDGLAKGDSLQVYRQESEEGRSLLLGMLRVVEVGDGEAVAVPLSDLKRTIQPGDHVLRIDISPDHNK